LNGERWIILTLMHSQKNNIYENEVEEEEEGKVFSVKIKIENRTNEWVWNHVASPAENTHSKTCYFKLTSKLEWRMILFCLKFNRKDSNRNQIRIEFDFLWALLKRKLRIVLPFFLSISLHIKFSLDSSSIKIFVLPE